MTTYVLVHGAWHGGWCWDRVAPLLRAQGHDVYTPTLTGLGEREHLASSNISLSTHVQDVVNLIEFEDLHDIVLMGHSYGGIVVTGVAGRVPGRIAHLMYLDAFLPGDGQSLQALVGGDFTPFFTIENSAANPPAPPFGDFGVTDPDDLALLRAKLRPHPLGTLTEGVVLKAPLEKQDFTRTYILAAGDDGNAEGLFVDVKARCSADPAWRCIDVNTGHDVMLTKPRELTDILLEVAQ